MPEPTWELFAHDGFSGTDLSDVDGRATDDLSGHHWSVPIGAALVESGKLRITSPVAHRTVARIDMGLLPGRTDGKIRVTVPVTSNRIGVFGRMNASGTTYYLAYLDAPWVYLFKVVDGTSYPLGRTSLLPQSPNLSFGLVVYASTLHVINAIGGTILTVIDSGISATGYWGLEITAAGRYADAVDFYLDEAAATTAAPTTLTPTTLAPTTLGPTTLPPTTLPPTTAPEPTFPPTTIGPTTVAPTTESPSTTVAPSTTTAPTTEAPNLAGSLIKAALSYVSERDRLICRAWVTDDDGRTRDVDLDPSLCELRLVDELGGERSILGSPDPELGVIRFVVDRARLYTEHLYLVRIMLDDVGPCCFGMPVN